MLIVDTNVIAYLYIEGDFTQQARTVYREDSIWAAPYLWRSEFRNILTVYLRQKILTLDECIERINSANKLLQNHEFELDSDSVLSLASSCSLSAYDCEYVVLARQLSLKLVTNDKKIIKEFPQDIIDLRTISTGINPNEE